MNKLIKLLIIYTALVNTAILIAFNLRPYPTKEISKLEQKIDSLSLNASSAGKLTAELDKIKAELTATKEAEVLGTGSPLPPGEEVLGYIKIADSSYSTIDVFSLASFSSPVVGKLQEGKSYGFLKKEDNWYLVQTSDGQEGYVSSRFVKETQEIP